MRLISWNVNGLRACLNKGFLDFVDAIRADVICLQETKLKEHQVNFELPLSASTQLLRMTGTAPTRRAIPARRCSQRPSR